MFTSDSSGVTPKARSRLAYPLCSQPPTCSRRQFDISLRARSFQGCPAYRYRNSFGARHTPIAPSYQNIELGNAIGAVHNSKKKKKSAANVSKERRMYAYLDRSADVSPLVINVATRDLFTIASVSAHTGEWVHQRSDSRKLPRIGDFMTNVRAQRKLYSELPWFIRSPNPAKICR